MQKRRKRTKTKTTFEKLWEKFIKLEKIYNQDSVRVKTWKKVAFSLSHTGLTHANCVIQMDKTTLSLTFRSNFSMNRKNEFLSY